MEGEQRPVRRPHAQRQRGGGHAHPCEASAWCPRPRQGCHASVRAVLPPACPPSLPRSGEKGGEKESTPAPRRQLSRGRQRAPTARAVRGKGGAGYQLHSLQQAPQRGRSLASWEIPWATKHGAPSSLRAAKSPRSHRRPGLRRQGLSPHPESATACAPLQQWPPPPRQAATGVWRVGRWGRCWPACRPSEPVASRAKTVAAGATADLMREVQLGVWGSLAWGSKPLRSLQPP
mmetsp:Transcript_16506/g.50711  ORF Transcript_16506/g.50711 Transcript_16506/m.50711 type:complete len:233 (-) Transcript_16506:132-830(-)